MNMSKETKMQEKITQQPVNSNKKYIALALVVLLAIIGIVMNNSNEEETITTITTEPEVIANVTEEKPIKEPTIARIDITTPLVNAEEPQLAVYVDGSSEPEKQARWMPKVNKQGYVVQKESHEIDITVKFLNNANTNVIFRGIDRRDDRNERIPVWVNYTSITVNGKNILPEETMVWHNKPFIFEIKGKTGEEYEIHTEWKEAEK